MPFLSFFLSFAHQTARESIEIACQHGIRQLVMVIMWKCNDPANKPLPHFLPNASMHKEGG